MLTPPSANTPNTHTSETSETSEVSEVSVTPDMSTSGAGAGNIDLEPLLEWGDLASDSVGADRVEGVLLGLAQVASQVVVGAEAASLTLVGPGGTLSTPEFTGALAKQMDALQYDAAQGPCVEAATATHWTAILVTDLHDQTQWPAVTGPGTTTGAAEAAGAAGAAGAAPARSVLSVSLFKGPRQGAGGTQPAVGSLNLYATTAGAFGEAERDTALLLALYAALALAATEAIDDAGQRMDQLKTAMTTQSVIGQAQGILMERHKLTAGQAFDRLRTASMNLNRKLRDVARDLSETGDEKVLTPRRAVAGNEPEPIKAAAGDGPEPLKTAAGDEPERIRAVARYDILDTPPDDVFDRVATIAAKLFGVPMATVSIVDTDRVWYKASQGLPGIRQVTRDPGLCASVILEPKPYVVPNTRTDPRTTTHPLVTGDPGLQFYAAAPITTSDGYHLGTVAVMDTKPREPTQEQVQMLTDLAAVVMDDLELRLSAMTALGDGRRSAFRPDCTCDLASTG